VSDPKKAHFRLDFVFHSKYIPGVHCHPYSDLQHRLGGKPTLSPALDFRLSTSPHPGLVMRDACILQGNGELSQSEDLMSDLYNSLKSRMHDTLPWRKSDAVPAIRVKNGNATGLNDEMERLERIIAHRLSRLKEAVRTGETIVSEESHRTEQLVENLRAEATILRDKLKQAEELIERKNLLQQQAEESLSAIIKNLQCDVKSRDETLAKRENEINNYKSMIEQNSKKITELEAAHTKAQEGIADQARSAEEFRQSSQHKIAALEAQLIELARQKTSAIEDLEQDLVAKAQEFESILKGKNDILTQRDSEIADLKAQLKRLTKSISDVSLLFKEAEALTGTETPRTTKSVSEEPLPEITDHRISSHSQNDKRIRRISPDAVSETVSAETFQKIITELGQATNVIGPLASLMVHQQAKALGESVEKFPRARLPELLEGLAKEIPDENRQMYFLQHFTQNERMTLN
jgi:DNA repair exonuclease SbcCD ATPase subunit